MLLGAGVGNNQKSGPFKEDNFIGFTHLAESIQLLFQHAHVRNEGVDNGRPSQVESFVPNGRLEASDLHGQGNAVELGFTVPENLLVHQALQWGGFLYLFFFVEYLPVRLTPREPDPFYE